MVSEKRGGASKYWAAAALAASSCILDLNPQPEEPETDRNDDVPTATEGRGGATQRRDTGANDISIGLGRGGARPVSATTVVVYSSGGSVAATVSHTTIEKGQDAGTGSGDLSSPEADGGSMGTGGAAETSTDDLPVGTGTGALGSGGSKSTTATLGTGGRRNTEVGGAQSPGGATSSGLLPSTAGRGTIGGGGGLAGLSGSKLFAGMSGLTSAGKRSL